MRNPGGLVPLLLLAAACAAGQSLTPARTGSFAQIAVGHFDVAGQRGAWNTTLVFMNTSSSPAAVHVRFFSSAGQAMALPLKGGGSAAEKELALPGYGGSRPPVKHETYNAPSAAIRRVVAPHVSQCLEIDMASQGKFEEVAPANLNEALELHFEPPPATRPPKVRTIEVENGAA